jgi:hypothetical protein
MRKPYGMRRSGWSKEYVAAKSIVVTGMSIKLLFLDSRESVMFVRRSWRIGPEILRCAVLGYEGVQAGEYGVGVYFANAD